MANLWPIMHMALSVLHETAKQTTTTIATIKNGEIIGIQGNGGNRFDRLSKEEKADCATILVKLENKLANTKTKV